MATTLLDKLTKHHPTASESAIMERAIITGPMLVDKERKYLEINITLPFYVPRKTLYDLESSIKQSYQLNSVTLNPIYDNMPFSDEYVEEIIVEAERRNILTKSYLGNHSATLTGNVLRICTGYGQGGVIMLNAAEISNKIETLIMNEFKTEIRVVFDQNEALGRKKIMTIAERLAQMESARSSAQNVEKAVVKDVRSSVYDDNPEMVIEGNIIKTGYMTFDISNPELLIGEEFDIVPTRLHDAPKTIGFPVFIGEVINYETKPRKRGYTGVSFCIHDCNAAISCRITLPNKDAEIYNEKISDGMCIAVNGEIKHDDFDNELLIVPRSVIKINKIERTDNAETKRVELHLHTTMSQMDALISPIEAVETAHRWGHKAVAFTDHGNVQGFQVAAGTAAKLGVKLIYGMESYFVNSNSTSKMAKTDHDFDDEFVVFDLETTGLSPISCKIIEIGAVKIKKGELGEIFSTFVDPQTPISQQITELTGIDDSMVVGAPKDVDAVKAFLEFVGDAPLIAHNAPFDTSFIRKVCQDNGISFTNDCLDTVVISRFVNPDLKKHKLDIVAEKYGITDFGHHRAYNDAQVTGQIFAYMVETLKNEGYPTVFSLQNAIAERSSAKNQKSYHQILLARNNTGLKNLYQIVSNGFLHDYYKHPRVSKEFLMDHREGLIVGSACSAGELYDAFLENRDPSEIKSIAEFYDYLEIQPLTNNSYLLSEDRNLTVEDLKNINRKIVKLGEELNKPVVATCDAHFLNKYDEIHRQVIQKGLKYKDADHSSAIYYRTTEEMLKEFDYLGEEKAYEVVVTNTNLIADMIEDGMVPFPDGTFTPHLEGAEDDLQRICYEKARDWYGDPIPEIVKTRLDKELNSIIKHGFAVLYMIAQKLVEYSESQGYLVGSRGSVGSSFVATMAGISEVNPLLPHYRCPKCRYSEFFTNHEVGSGFDLPDKKCPNCGEPLIGDGHDIPFETFLGFKGDKSPDIDLNFSGDVQGRVHKYTEELFGTENVYRAGTIGEVASKTAYGFVKKYLEEKGFEVSAAEINRLITKCVGVKRTTGQHPGGIVVVPKELDITDFCPVQHPADEPNSNIITTHFSFEFLHDTLLKLDELGHDIPTKYKYIEKFSNTSVMDVPMNAPEVYQLFSSIEPLKVEEGNNIYCEIGTLGIPEFGTNFVMPVVIESKPKTFADLLQVSGLTHGTDVWLGNAQDLIKNNICTISEVVGTRDGIMIDLIRYGLENGTAFKIMEFVRKNKKGKPIPEPMLEAMHEHNVDEWYIDSLKKIKYMFPKAHAAAYVMSAIRLAWYKINMPIAFYCGFLSAAPKGFDSSIVMKGKNFVRKNIDLLKEKGREATQKEGDLLDALLMANEALSRGYEFLPVDIYKSDAKEFIPEDGKIRVPFTSLPGLGESAAISIQKCRDDGPFMSIEDLKDRAMITKAVIEVLRENNCLAGMSETNQLTLF